MMTKRLFFTGMILAALFITGCRKEQNEGNAPVPNQFTDLKVNPDFKFQSITDVDVTIKVETTGKTSLKVIEIYQGNPAQGGKLISRGATGSNSEYKTRVRIPSRINELYIGKLSSDGNNRFAAVPVTGSTLFYDFNQPLKELKSGTLVQSGPDCGSGCTQTLSGNIQNLVINSGQSCILSGVSVTIGTLTINNGGVLMICGTATIGNINSWSSSSVIVSSTGILQYANMSFGNGLHIDNYGIIDASAINVNSGGSIHTYPSSTTTVSGQVNNGGTFINEGTLSVTGTFNNNGGNVLFNNSGTITVGNGLSNNAALVNTGSLTVNNNNLTINGGSTFTNSGIVMVNGAMVNMAVTTNNGTITVAKTFTNNGGSTLTNGCKLLIGGDFTQMGTINNNSYIKVTGTAPGTTGATVVNGGAVINMGVQAFMETNHLQMNGTISGPSSPGSRINIAGTTTIGWGTAVNNYVDLCDPNGIESNHGTIGPDVTYCSFQIIPDECNPGTGSAPVITSPLTASGTTGVQFSYLITASGSPVITFSVSGLPAGLTFSGATIGGAPNQAGTYNVLLTATSYFGSDTKTLVLSIGGGGTVPSITSPLIASGIQGQPFNYIMTATGTQPIQFSATNLPAGLVFNDNVISGIPTVTGLFEIELNASNAYGQDQQTLSLTITSPVGPTDTDGDTVPDDLDAYPTDPTRAFNSFYPNEIDFGTLAFEDLWPAYGDYDFNDLVVNFQYKIVTNAQNKVVDILSNYKIKAVGASLNNGFGIILNVPPSVVEEVTGCVQMGEAVSIDPKGYEAGHLAETVVIPFDAVNTIMGQGYVNTIHGGYTVQPTLQVVGIHFSTVQDLETIGYPPFNPFMFVNQEREKEIHLKDHAPSELVNPVWYHTYSDASDPSLGHYYRSSSALPWALEIPVDFNYPIENADILTVYLHFAEWAQSSGTLYPDWYMDKPGYRNASKIY